MIARAFSSVLALAAVAAGAWSPARPSAPVREAVGYRAAALADSFPHTRHVKLFTTCTTCHAGIASGDTATMMPKAEVCAGCHNGEMQRRVELQPRPLRVTNLQLDHGPHVAMFEGMEGGAQTACQRCHARADSLPFMEVGRANPDRCLSCHGQGATTHLTQQACEPCHTALHGAAQVTVAMIRGFPKPPSHDLTWALRHAPSAASPTCNVCHARDFCASCHVNAATVQTIQNLAADERVASIVQGRRAQYPVPATHATDTWTRSHGLVARAGVQECANCHAQESCLGCHRAEERVPPVRALPRRTRGGAYGVDLAGLRPADHLPDQLLRHRVPAAGGDAACSRCHAQSYCASCHDGAESPVFHGANFVQRHGQEASTQEAECSSCHQTQAFCVSCHRSVGQSGTSAPFGKYHDRQPGWLFGHGGVARRSIESCAGCHPQDFCIRCHSATTGWGVNPHGSRFDASVQKKNRAMCTICHGTNVPQ
jgi:hypothetical protein